VKKRVIGIVAVGLVGTVLGLSYLLNDDSSVVKTTYARHDAFAQKGQAMVPWRAPQTDLAALFPGAPLPDLTTPKIVALSARRAEILQRLGKDTPLDSNALYIYPITGRGAVLLRRAAGEFGAIEIVLGVDAHGKVVGVRLQRHREPPEIEKALRAPAFLESFSGKTAQSTFALPKALPPVATSSARAVLRAVRALLIEYDAGTRP
jgi:hypothetical protein